MPRLAACCGIASTVLAMAAAPTIAQNWADRSEYDLVLALRAQGDAAKRLEIIDQWKQKFPNSELGQVRRELQLTAYEELGDTAKMLAVAREMVARDPRGFLGLYWLTVLTPGAADITPDRLTQAEQAIRALIKEAPDALSPDRKPAGSQGAEWDKRRLQVEVLAHRALGWIHWQRTEYDAAVSEFRAALQIDPKQAEISAWLGAVLAVQKAPEKQLEAIWHLSRAAYLPGENALPAAQLGDVHGLLERAYSAYHGGTDGLDQVGAMAVASVMPPENFRIESAAEAAMRRNDEELSRTNPMLLSWLKIRRQLESADGERNFQALIASGIPTLKGFVVRQAPARRPTEVFVGIQDPAIEEVTLRLRAPLPGAAEPGASIEFEGVPVSFTAKPFMLVVESGRDKISGWPGLR